MSKKAKKGTVSHARALLLLIGGIVCLSMFVGYRVHKTQRLSFTKAPLATTHPNTPQSPVSIEIIPLSITLPVAPARVEGNNWEINETGASFLTSSAPLKNNGNTVIYAHNKSSLFGPLTEIKIGYPITLKSRDGKIYSYSVYKIDTVTPDKIEVIKSVGREELTLYTCTGFADTKRLVVKAKPI